MFKAARVAFVADEHASSPAYRESEGERVAFVHHDPEMFAEQLPIGHRGVCGRVHAVVGHI